MDTPTYAYLSSAMKWILHNIMAIMKGTLWKVPIMLDNTTYIMPGASLCSTQSFGLPANKNNQSLQHVRPPKSSLTYTETQTSSGIHPSCFQKLHLISSNSSSQVWKLSHPMGLFMIIVGNNLSSIMKSSRIYPLQNTFPPTQEKPIKMSLPFFKHPPLIPTFFPTFKRFCQVLASSASSPSPDNATRRQPTRTPAWPGMEGGPGWP